MPNPPFKLAARHAPGNAAATYQPQGCCEDIEAGPEISSARARLIQLNQHFHCSVLGTCMSTLELRKIAGRFMDAKTATDLEVHHEAVILASQTVPAKALHKALDQRHAAAIARFNKIRDPNALVVLWEEALKQGEIPGAYWALLTHRDVTTEIRNKAFGDVHMLSHLVGAANRADIRRLVAIEHENADLRERVERQTLRSQEIAIAHDQLVERLQEQLAQTHGQLALAHEKTRQGRPSAPAENGASLVALQTQRREQAEQSAANALVEIARLQSEMDVLKRHVGIQADELSAAETQLRQLSDPEGESASPLQIHIEGRRILYVGGRPSSTPAIKSLVERHGGEFQRHGGGNEDRRGLLESAVAAADIVVFPVDCIDHDSAGTLKRLCVRQGIPFVPMRKASVASFAVALSSHAVSAGYAPPAN